MNENQPDAKVIPGENSSEQNFVPPAGWARSANISTSRFAFEISNSTKWYVNDGKGNGYFAPGWDNERIARKTGLLRWIGLAAAVVILVVGGIHFTLEYSKQDTYAAVKAAGVESIGVVGPVAVEHSTRRPRQSGWKYTTRSTAPIEYIVDGRRVRGEITESRTETSTIGTTGDFPGPAWTQGQRLKLYADPANPDRFVLFHENKEADLETMSRGPLVVLIVTGVALVVPVLLIIVSARNVRKARTL